VWKRLKSWFGRKTPDQTQNPTKIYLVQNLRTVEQCPGKPVRVYILQNPSTALETGIAAGSIDTLELEGGLLTFHCQADEALATSRVVNVEADHDKFIVFGTFHGQTKVEKEAEEERRKALDELRAEARDA